MKILSYIRWLFISILLILSEKELFAQTTIGDVVTSNDSIHNAYIKDFSQNYMARVFYANRNFSFNLRSKIGEKKSIHYAPNGQNFVGAGFFYKKMGLELGFKLPVSDVLEARYGRTRFIDLQTNYYGDKIGADLAFQRYRGFYVKNPYEADTAWLPGYNYPQRKDIITLNISGNIYYIFNNKKFSYRAAFAQTEQQIKTAGSFVLMGAAAHIRFDARNSFIPAALLSGFGESASFRQGSFYSIAVLPGYAHTFVLDKYYLSLSFHMGVGVQHKHYILGARVYDDVNISRKNNLRIAGGYYGKRFLGGLSVIIDNTPIQMQNIVLSASTFNIKMFVGYRFDSKRLDRNVEKIKTKYRKLK
jgi:hypothetical protein